MLEQAADERADARIALRLIRRRCRGSRRGRRLRLSRSCGRGLGHSFSNSLKLLIRRLILHADDRRAGADAEEAGLGALDDLNGNIIPVKAKWLAWAELALSAYDMCKFARYGLWAWALMPVVAVVNYLIFFWDDAMAMLGRSRERMAYRTSHQTIQFKKAQKDIQQRKGYLHKCAVCGITDADDPNMEFRYCSKCNGYYCYCMKHINDHVHVQ